MNGEPVTFRKTAIQPIDCIRSGWEGIKGQYWLLMAITLVGMLLSSLAYGVIAGPMMCGIYMAILATLRGEPAGFDRLWRGFDYFVPSLLVLLVLVAVILVLLMPIALVAMASVVAFAGHVSADNAATDLWTVFVPLWSVLALVYLVLGSLLSVLFSFTFLLLVDKGLRPMDALWLGSRAAWAHLGGLLGLYLLTLVIGLGGLLLCYFGVFLIAPIQFAAWVAAYRKVFPETVPVA